MEATAKVVHAIKAGSVSTPNLDMELFIGFEAGGTHTRALLGTQQAVLSEGRAGSANPGAVGFPGMIEALVTAAKAALQASWLDEDELKNVTAFAGVAGLGRPSDLERFRAEEHPFAQLEAESDALLTLRAAFGTGPGTILIVGTGSIAMSRDAQGQISRAGGWGFPLERGGGSWLGLEGLRLGLDALEQGHDTPLAKYCRDLGGVTPIIEWARKAKPADYAAQATLVFQAAKEGDVGAIKLLTHWGKILEDTLMIVAPSGPWALWGGMGKALEPQLSSGLLDRKKNVERTPLETALETARMFGTKKTGQV